MIDTHDILETINMIDNENLDVRTITMGISLLDCIDSDIDKACTKVYDKICSHAENLVKTGERHRAASSAFRSSISASPSRPSPCWRGLQTPVQAPFALPRHWTAPQRPVGVNFIGGYSALVQKGFAPGDRRLRSPPSRKHWPDTEFVCSSVNVGSTQGRHQHGRREANGSHRQGSRRPHRGPRRHRLRQSSSCSATHRRTTPSWPALSTASARPDTRHQRGRFRPGRGARTPSGRAKGTDTSTWCAETIKKTAFKITRMGQLVAQEASPPSGRAVRYRRPLPCPHPGYRRQRGAISWRSMGLAQCGAHGTTAALALLNDAVKKGGVMASGTCWRPFRRVHSRSARTTA